MGRPPARKPLFAAANDLMDQRDVLAVQRTTLREE